MSPAKIPPKTDKPAKDTVYVDVDDEITAIIDKVESSKQKIVALVLPKRFAALQSIVNMRLLKRSADNADKSVVLITSETALLPLAGAAGLHVAKNLQSKPEIPPAPFGVTASESQEQPEAEEDEDTVSEKPAKLDYHRSMGELAASDSVEEPETIALGDEDEATEAGKEQEKAPAAPKDKKLKVPNFEKFRLWIVLGTLGFISLIVFIFLALVVWPHATITIQTESSPVSADLNLTTSGSATTLDEAKNIIPAALKSTTQTSNQQVNATGQQNNGKKATGTVTLTNCSSNGSEVKIPAGTGVSSSSGLTFITQSSVDLNGLYTVNGTCEPSSNTSATVGIVAQSGGANYNGATNFSVANNSSVTATASNPTSGGTDNITTVVSQSDLNNAKKAISTQDTNNFTSQFETTLSGQGLYVLTSTLKAANPVITSTPSVGQPASQVSVTIKITYSVLTVQKSDLQKAVGDALNKQIDSSRQKLVNSDPLQGATVTVQSQSSPTVAILSVNETTSAMPIFDVDGIKKQAAGQKNGDITSMVTGIPGVKSASVKMTPFWVSKAPKNTGKITIIFQQESN